MDAGDRERGLGYVGRQDHPTGAMGLEDPRLLLIPLAGEERQHLGGGWVVLAQGLGGLADLPLAREEHQHIPPALPGQLGHGVRDRLLHGLVALAGALVISRWAIADLHRIGATRDLDDGRRGAIHLGKMPGEAPRFDGGGGDDHLQLRSARQQTLQVAQQEIDVEAALVSLIDDQGVVFEESTIVLDLGEQHPVRHQLDTGLGAHPIMKTDLVAHQIPEFTAQFLGDPAGQAAGGDPPRLGVADPPVQAASQVQTELG